ncbi:hypothetical protein EON67_09200, partial [archaeon]
MLMGVRARTPFRRLCVRPRARARAESDVYAPPVAVAAVRTTSLCDTRPPCLALRAVAGLSKSSHKKKAEEWEFGGPIGAAAIMIVSHVLLYYVYYVINLNGGALFIPRSLADVTPVVQQLVDTCAPSWRIAAIYVGFLAVEAVFAVVMPGLDLNGRADETGAVLKYRCNAYMSWWVTLAVLGALHYTGTFDFGEIASHVGSYMTVAIIFADIASVWVYVYAFVAKLTHRMSGNHVYDFFMGGILHPRIGILDIKMFAEIRMSWFLLFILTASGAVYRHQQDLMSNPNAEWNQSSLFMILAHFLYANACAKGEHYVPPTWDIFHEKFGWMLCFWNFAGVPFLYCAQAMYIAKVNVQLSTELITVLTIALLATYYVWDTAQGQK